MAQDEPRRSFWLMHQGATPPVGYTAFDIGPPYAPQEFTIALPEDEAEVLRDFYGWRNRWSTVTASELTLYDDEGKLLQFNSDGKIIREVK